MSGVVVAGAVSAAVIWGLSANDPYWRLVEVPSVPAPAYDSADELRTMAAAGPREFGNVDAGATNPATDTLASDSPMIALVPPLEPETMVSPTTDTLTAYELPRAGIGAPADVDRTAVQVSVFSPSPLPAPTAAPADSGVVAVTDTRSLRASPVFVVPELLADPATDSVTAYGLSHAGTAAPADRARATIAFSTAPIPTPVGYGDVSASAAVETVSTGAPIRSAAPETMSGPTVSVLAAYRLPPAAIDAPAGSDDLATGSVIAFSPATLPAPVTPPDSVAMAESVSTRPPDLFVMPETPAQPRVASNEETEAALALKRAGRIDVQRRLALAGFDPKGHDGVFGQRTRRAISDFQTAWGFPATGYLEASVYADLNQRTEGAYQALKHRAAAAPSAAPALAPVAQERQLAETDSRCTRDTDGRIIGRQSFACDVAGFGEQFVTLGRNTLEFGADGAAAAGAALGITGDSNR